MTLNFWRMCTANLLLFISVYMLFPLLPFVMGEQLGVSVGQAGSMFLVFAVAMFAVGPFHAYLVDEYKRKHVLLYSALIMLAAVLGYAFVDGYTKFLLLAAVQGACFGLATTAAAQETWYMHGLHAWACWWVLCWALECIRCMVSVW